MLRFAERLRYLRRRQNLTLEKLATELNSTKTTLSRYENNKRSPDADFIVKTAKYFSVSSDYLLGLSDHPTTVSDFIADTEFQEILAEAKRFLANNS